MANDGALVAGTNDGRIAMRMLTDNAWHLVSAWSGAGEVRTLTAEPLHREIVYAGTSTGKVLRSDNGGLDWYLQADLREGDEGIFQVNALAIASDQPKSIYLDGYGVGGNRLWKGTQGEDKCSSGNPWLARGHRRTVPWEFQSQRVDTDHFNRDFKPELARGGAGRYCRLNPCSGNLSVLTHSEPPVWDFTPANPPMPGSSCSAELKRAVFRRSR